MKTNPLLTVLAVTGATLVFAVPTALPQDALRADTSGSLLTPLSLGSTQLTGKLPPDRLGSGTPTSTTFLRGDGSWAGMTAGGNTVASTGSLLMGDSAGNAVALGSSADLHRVIQARADTASASLTAPQNLLPLSTIHLGTSTQNADGTITIAANSYVYWDNDPTTGTGLAHYAYVVATGDVAAGALSPGGWYAGFGNVDEGNTRTRLAPGVFKAVFSNGVGAGAYQFGVQNNTSSPITIYYPFLGLIDPGHPIFSSYQEATAVAAPPVADLDFTRFASESADRSTRYRLELGTTLAADSVNGSSGNAGTLYAPKPTIGALSMVNGSVVGLLRGSTFRESLPLSTLGTTHGVVVQDVALGSVKPLPIISALDPVNNGSVTSNGFGSYSYLWTPGDTLDNSGYSNVYLVEINTATEALMPIASRRRMSDVADESEVEGNPGGCWIQSPGTGAGQSGSTTQWKVNFHPSDGLAPGSGSYRYEVVSRLQPANWGSFDSNAGDGAMSGLMLVGSNNGYGELGAPRGFVGDRLAFIHATTHNAVIGGGSLQRSVFYESGDLANGSGPSIQLAWYAGTGTGLRWDTRHCLFYMNVGDRFANGLISHTGSGTYDRGDLSDSVFLGARWSNGSLQGTAIDYAAVATGVINRVFVQGVRNAFGPNMPLAAEVKNSVFRQVQAVSVRLNFHDNIVQTVNGADTSDPNNRSPNACTLAQDGASATRNLFWSHTDTVSGVTNDDSALGIAVAGNGTTFAHNIVVLDPRNTGVMRYLALYASNKASVTIDYNLVISLGKGGVGGDNPTPGPLGFNTWHDYQTGQTLYDQHSLYVDLSTDPRGLAAVFVDPANGDFRWAQTDVARRCALYCRANQVGPAAVTSRWPLVPTVDEAVRLLTDL